MEDNYDAEIYVDGSYDVHSKSYAYGMTVEDKNGMHYFKKAFPADDKSSMRNVAGEIAGAQAGMQYALDNGYKNIHMLYDYVGIESWCTGSWKAKNPATQAYKQFYDKAAEDLHIDFEHVKGHSGVENNEICDALAKSALNLSDTAARKAKYADILKQAVPYESEISQDSMIGHVADYNVKVDFNDVRQVTIERENSFGLQSDSFWANAQKNAIMQFSNTSEGRIMRELSIYDAMNVIKSRFDEARINHDESIDVSVMTRDNFIRAYKLSDIQRFYDAADKSKAVKVSSNDTETYIGDEMQLKKQRFSATITDSSMKIDDGKERDSNECSEYQ